MPACDCDHGRSLLGGLLGPSNLLTPAIGVIMPLGWPLLCGAVLMLPDLMCRISGKLEVGIVMRSVGCGSDK